MSRRQSAGFTLLELIVSLAIAALATAGLTQVVRDAAGLNGRLEERLRSAGEAEALFSLLETLLADTPRELGGEALRVAGSSGAPSVAGDSQRITVISRGPRILGLIEPTPFTLAFEAGSSPERGRVLLSWTSATGASEPELVVRARDFALRYGFKNAARELAWAGGWSRSVEALAVIEASFVEAASGRRVTRVIPVVTTLPRICVLQPLLEGCPEWR